jgi:glycosyltransferase involved in cell wall biosynthesis
MQIELILKEYMLVKKQLLFVTQYLHTGGIEKSLLTLLSEIDYDQYDVDLLLFDHSGVLFKMVPQQVNILPPLFETYSTPLLMAVPALIKKGRFRLLTGKVLSATLPRFSKGMGTGVRWAIYRHSLNNVKKHYDVAISYIDFFCNYFVIEKVNADKKIVYNHMDYLYSQKSGWPCPRLERKSFSKSDYIVSVAESSRESLESFFPEFSNKMRVIHNRVSTETVRKMANESSVTVEMNHHNVFKIVTVARLVEEKGVLLALGACKILIEQGFAISWFLIGNGSLREGLQTQAKALGIEKHFILLGEKANPYPYMKECDVYVQPSKTEAHCVAVEEAIALSCPIVVTDIPSFHQQIKHEESGIIVKTTPEGIAEGIGLLLNSSELREKLTSHLLNAGERNNEELGKFYQLIEG